MESIWRGYSKTKHGDIMQGTKMATAPVQPRPGWQPPSVKRLYYIHLPSKYLLETLEEEEEANRNI